MKKLAYKKKKKELNIQKTKITASGPITSRQIDGETLETVRDFIFLGSKITTNGDCSHEIKRCLLLGRKAMTNVGSILKSRDITLPTKVHLVKAMVFPVVKNGCESWTIKKARHQRIDAFELWCWRRLLRVPWLARTSNQSILKEISERVTGKKARGPHAVGGNNCTWQFFVFVFLFLLYTKLKEAFFDSVLMTPGSALS